MLASPASRAANTRRCPARTVTSPSVLRCARTGVRTPFSLILCTNAAVIGAVGRTFVSIDEGVRVEVFDGARHGGVAHDLVLPFVQLFLFACLARGSRVSGSGAQCRDVEYRRERARVRICRESPERSPR